jgi:hypothetical protein
MLVGKKFLVFDVVDGIGLARGQVRGLVWARAHGRMLEVYTRSGTPGTHPPEGR